jgi:hypothetical protein
VQEHDAQKCHARGKSAVYCAIQGALCDRMGSESRCSRSLSSKRFSAAVAYVFRPTWTSFRKIGRSANHSMLNSMRAKTSRCDARRDDSTADAQITAFSESAEGKLERPTRCQPMGACASKERCPL